MLCLSGGRRDADFLLAKKGVDGTGFADIRIAYEADHQFGWSFSGGVGKSWQK